MKKSFHNIFIVALKAVTFILVMILFAVSTPTLSIQDVKAGYLLPS
jgi:hypothetical protein